MQARLWETSKRSGKLKARVHEACEPAKPNQDLCVARVLSFDFLEPEEPGIQCQWFKHVKHEFFIHVQQT